MRPRGGGTLGDAGGSHQDGRSGERLESGANLLPDHRPDAALRHRESGLRWSCVGLRVAHCPPLARVALDVQPYVVSGQRRNDHASDRADRIRSINLGSYSLDALRSAKLDNVF